MNINTNRVRDCLGRFDFKTLFIEELGWNICNNRPVDVQVDTQTFRLSPFAEQGGMVIYLGESPEDGTIPPSNIRRVVETRIAKQTHEHMVVFIDRDRTRSVWQWVRRQRGNQTAAREHTYYKGQPGDSLLQKLAGIAFSIDDLDEEGRVAITEVIGRVEKVFNVEKVTRHFYDQYKREHGNFSKFLKGLEGQDDLSWYTSVMLDRLMFIYFIQKKGFLDGHIDYLANKLKESKSRGANQFYRKFLIRLFFEGFAKEEKDRSLEINHLLGKVPYLNGGLFLPHQLELAYGEKINISDAAFEGLFAFFDRYSWHLDYRPLRADNEINPDVLGYIFEKYVNQKQMGAYYTKEDITDYICKNTIIPFLFDKLESMRYDELHPFPMKEVEPYIYETIKQEDYLPTETEREYKQRRKRYEQIKEDFAAGKITSINDMVTYNLNVRKFAEDWARGIKDPVTLRAFYFHCLTNVTVLDPAVGSGAFLFAALNMLEPLYETCLDKMEELRGPKYPDFSEELARIRQHPNRKYFIFKSIIVNNLFGVDIMEEAIEICKLRLFLKLVSQVDDVSKIEPLPDIDFNIRAGNSLVGYANKEEIEKAKATKLDLSGAMKGIEGRIESANRALQSFRSLQMRLGIPASELTEAKAEVKDRLAEIQGELDRDLAAFYGAHDMDQFVQTHQPFHWFVEFYSIMKSGGFDVIIGNPPFVEYGRVRDEYTVWGYQTESCGNLYAFIIERSLKICRHEGRWGLIMQLSSVSTRNMTPLHNFVRSGCSELYISCYAERPQQLFTGACIPLAIMIGRRNNTNRLKCTTFTTAVYRWHESERNTLFQRLRYCKHSDVIDDTHFFVPKIQSALELSIYEKFFAQAPISKYRLSTINQNNIYYRTAGGRYWKVILNFPFGNESTANKVTSFQQNLPALVAVSILSSNLFWWYYIISFDLYNLKDYVLFDFRFSCDIADPTTLQKLTQLGKQLMSDYRKNANQKTVFIRSKQQYATYPEYLPRLSKPIIDEIDRVLAKHYGLTEEELDFVINYDIKYRMGKDAEE